MLGEVIIANVNTVTEDSYEEDIWKPNKYPNENKYEGWNFNFGNAPLDWIQELLE